MSQNMNDEQQKQFNQIVDQIKDEVVENSVAAVTREALNSVKEGLAEIRNLSGDDNKQKEARENAANYIKAMYNNDRAKVKDLSGGTDNEGAELVPEYFSSELIRIANSYGLVRRKARRVPLTGKLNFPTADGVVSYRIGSTEKIPVSSVNTDNVTLDPQKIACLVPVDNDLLSDANIDVVDLIALLGGESIALKEDQWGLAGLAAGEGILQGTNVPSRDMESGSTSFDDTTWTDLLLMQNLLDDDAIEGAEYVMSRSVWNLLRAKTIGDADARYIFQAPGDSQPATIWNLPVNWSKVMPGANDADQEDTAFLALANFRYMMFGDRKQVSMEISREATVPSNDGSTTLNLFERDMSAIRLIERVDIELALQDKAFSVLTTAAT